MPKSKQRSTSTRPQNAAPPKEERTAFFCCRCEKKYTKQKNNFPASQSSIYRGNGKYLPICYHCVEELFDHYKASLSNEQEAIKRICLKFDIYWHPEIYAMLNKASTSQSRIRAYISKANLIKYIGKTFDDTLDEEYLSELNKEAEKRELIEKEQRELEESIVKTATPIYDEDTEEVIVDKSVIQYWGTGFTPKMYLELEERRDYWLSQYPEGTTLNPGEEGLLRQICNLEISINKDRAAGRAIDKSINTLNTLFGSMNIKPSQKKELEENYIPFGVEIAKFEETEPIPEPDKDFEDVDGLRHNILTWFLGSLCKTSGTKNMYSQLFDEEIQKYTVERPQYDDVEENMEDEDGGDE